MVDDRCGYDIFLVLRLLTLVDVAFNKQCMCAIIIWIKLVIVGSYKKIKEIELNEYKCLIWTL